MNMLLINNLFDNSIFFEIFILATLFFGFVVAVADKEELDGKYYNFGSSIFFSLIVFRIFLWI